MTSPYQNPWKRNPWSRNPYTHDRLDAAKAAARKARQALMLNVVLWSMPAAMAVVGMVILTVR